VVEGGEYTTAFKNSSPRFCIRHPTEKRTTNCRKCKRQAKRVAKSASATQDEKDVAEERYVFVSMQMCVIRQNATKSRKQGVVKLHPVLSHLVMWTVVG